MKKFLATLLLVAILVSSVAFATNVVFQKNAYLYRHPRYGKTETVIHKGSVAPIVGKLVKNTKSHYQAIKVNKKTFYVRADLIHVDTKGLPVRITYSKGGTNKSKVTGSPVKDTAYSRVYVKKGKKVNVRTSPSLQGKANGASLKGGKWVTYLQEYQKDSRGVKFFHVIDSHKRKGWVSEEYTYRVK